MTIGGTITATDASAIKYTYNNDVAWTLISDTESKKFKPLLHKLNAMYCE